MKSHNCQRCNRRTKNESCICNRFMCRFHARLCIKCGGKKEESSRVVCTKCDETKPAVSEQGNSQPNSR